MLKYIFIFFRENITKILILIILVMLTIVSFEQKKIIHSNYFKNSSNVFHPDGVTKIKVENWRNYYGGNSASDSVINIDNSIRISTGVDSGWYGARGNFEKIDFSNKSIRFFIRSDDFFSLKNFRILLSSDNGKFDNYFSFNVLNFFNQPSNDEWHEIVIDTSVFEVAEGFPDWSNITDIAIRASSHEGSSVKVWFDYFSYIDKKNNPVITFTFDDGFKSVMDAAQIMNEYGIKGTVYIIPSYLGSENYLNQSDVDYLHNLGWDISGHGHTNLRLYSIVDADADLAKTREYLDLHNYRGREHYAYPNGGYTEPIRSLVAEYFETARTIDGFSQPSEYLILTKINAKTISFIHPVVYIKNWIDDAVRDGSWLILNWHDLVDDPKDDVQYSIDGFREILEYILINNFEILQFSEAYNRFMDK